MAKFVDINLAPAKNEKAILKASRQIFLADKLAFFWFLAVWQLSDFGFVHLPEGPEFWALVLLIIASVPLMSFMVWNMFFGIRDTDYGYVNKKQQEELFQIAKTNPAVGKYLFLTRVSGRPLYVAEWKALVAMAMKPYMEQ